MAVERKIPEAVFFIHAAAEHETETAPGHRFQLMLIGFLMFHGMLPFCSVLSAGRSALRFAVSSYSIV